MTPADSATEAHRHACEARHLLALPTLAGRREALAAREERRGKPEADRLRETMTALSAAGRGAAA